MDAKSHVHVTVNDSTPLSEGNLRRLGSSQIRRNPGLKDLVLEGRWLDVHMHGRMHSKLTIVTDLEELDSLEHGSGSKTVVSPSASLGIGSQTRGSAGGLPGMAVCPHVDQMPRIKGHLEGSNLLGLSIEVPRNEHRLIAHAADLA